MANFLQQLVSVISSGTVITVAAFHCASAVFQFLRPFFLRKKKNQQQRVTTLWCKGASRMRVTCALSLLSQ